MFCSYRAGKLDDTCTVVAVVVVVADVVVGVATTASIAACSRGAWGRSGHRDIFGCPVVF